MQKEVEELKDAIRVSYFIIMLFVKYTYISHEPGLLIQCNGVNLFVQHMEDLHVQFVHLTEGCALRKFFEGSPVL